MLSDEQGATAPTIAACSRERLPAATDFVKPLPRQAEDGGLAPISTEAHAQWHRSPVDLNYLKNK